ncbi:hypothetical protein RHGRI_006659 [Rhododendron griersonianum]|uniref:CID domain-containing protein n=1 Tax=Rhododendron griersonianum TaxID=479676 RepID=A0AAV6KU03_9ERIC|nr:hypothetical protein RHGRI_006659 [Rhododendron griersonianum]
MSDNVFDGQIFAEKLSKLNSSQQSIESLSRLCISHRKKARQIVETWDKAFSTAQRDQRVSFLYLANDILQNSRRKGSEFVNEFWKVLPAALKHVYDNGDENGKKAACRLVDIWEERKVFGSRGQNLKDEMLGKHPPPSISNGKSSNPIKIVKRDSHSLRIKLAVGGMPEKILTAFQSAHDENVTEETALNKCKAAASLVGKMEKEVEITSAQGNQQGSLLIDEIQEQENILEQCVSQLENAEASRGALVSQLKEAIQEQSRLGLTYWLTRSGLNMYHENASKVTRGHIEHLGNMKHMLMSPRVPASMAAATNQPTESPLVPSPHSTTNNQLLQPVNSFASVKTSEEENKKAAAAAVAAKLTASTSSAQMLTSILSSLVAEEAASKSSGALKSAGFSSSLPMFSPEKRPRLENPLPVTDVNSNSDMGGGTGYFTSLQSIQANQMQSPFPPPPPPPVPSGNSSANQFGQPSGMMMGVMPYAYGATSLPPPPPPLPSHIAQALARPPLQPPLPQQPPPPPQQQQQPMNGGYYRPPGIGFQGQSHQPTTPPPVPRQ